ncbi:MULTISPECIES: RrF2 family transcriptional regulator [Cetobacterium]|jgi:Rrf2 family protein|uniref:Rrf2 family transcriptional regulator n=1 Tax=Candidatus Cetobacterium colombiensis TaxID=3073100 RepID=A0ABU4WCQ7_9FUSO|nr:Rrf2 family transcriptional regulator [Candidatus Cetobacterium colombiensis]MDX8336950.1 Rrf2 family transcriptional regulator [Candidatus Cetobacterium colombiensis]
MKMSVGVEYALHCLLYIVKLKGKDYVGIKDLAEFQGVSESYLAKVFTKLGKAGITKSVSGVKGGYELAKDPENISFWDVVEAVEGKEPLFQCAEIRQKNILIDQNNLPDSYTKCPCFIKVVMQEGEDEMKKYLSKKTLAWLYNEVYGRILPAETENKTHQWFKSKRETI